MTLCGNGEKGIIKVFKLSFCDVSFGPGTREEGKEKGE